MQVGEQNIKKEDKKIEKKKEVKKKLSEDEQMMKEMDFGDDIIQASENNL